MQPNDAVAIESEPIVGHLKTAIPMQGGGKMTFVSSSPFEKDGQKYRKVISLRDKTRAYKKKIMRELKMNGKQFRKWEKEMRRKEPTKAVA